MKYPKYVYKRMNGQEYYCGVSDSVIENLKYERKKPNCGAVEPVNKIS